MGDFEIFFAVVSVTVLGFIVYNVINSFSFLLYDIELIFLFPFVSGITFLGLYDSLIILLFFSALLVSLIFDFNRHALVWQY